MKKKAHEKAVQGAAEAPLSSEQRRRLAALCHYAWDALGRPGGDFDAWRHRQTRLCVEQGGLKQCRNEDYSYIRAHMLAILGRKAAAERSRKAAEDNSRRQALHKLRAECDACRFLEHPRRYVIAIAKRKFGTERVETLSAKQIWQLVFSLRNGENRKKRKGY